MAAQAWLEAREPELLRLPYFHVVFTLPAAIGAIAYQNKAKVYGLLFTAAAKTLTTIAADPKHLGADIGLTAVLHTWGQSLDYHPHVHCIVPGGGVSPDGVSWVRCRPDFFLPVRVLPRLFRRLFLKGLVAAFDAGELQFFTNLAALRDWAGFKAYLAPLHKREWVVYAKRPFAGCGRYHWVRNVFQVVTMKVGIYRAIARLRKTSFLKAQQQFAAHRRDGARVKWIDRGVQGALDEGTPRGR